jgi:hypothetical protein
MSWLDKGRKAVKRAVAPISRPLEKILKPVARPLRPIASKVAGFTPQALFFNAKTFGIRSKRGTEGFERSQKVNRIGTGAVAVIAGGYVAGPAIGGAVSKTGSVLWAGAVKAGSALSLGATSLLGALGKGKGTGVQDMAEFAALATPLLGTNDPRADSAGGYDAYGDDFAPDVGRAVEGQAATAGVAPWVWVVGAAGLVIGGMFFFRGKGTA